ncbi:MAG: antitoxin family protein [Chloroflexi bacterium]|nr:antitoxin family protein [Chloroflexota bacterium]
MARTVRALFDGEVLRPVYPVDLEPNTVYVVTIECEVPAEERTAEAYPLTEIARLATDMGVPDLSTRHNWYAHGRVGDEPGGT